MPQILLAEDSRDYMLQIVALFRDMAIQLTWAANGQLAIEHVADEARPLDLLITDLDMPYRTGWDVIEATRLYRGPQVPIIMQTGEADFPTVQRRARELGIVLIDKEALRYELVQAALQALSSA